MQKKIFFGQTVCGGVGVCVFFLKKVFFLFLKEETCTRLFGIFWSTFRIEMHIFMFNYEKY